MSSTILLLYISSTESYISYRIYSLDNLFMLNYLEKLFAFVEECVIKEININKITLDWFEEKSYD